MLTPALQERLHDFEHRLREMYKYLDMAAKRQKLESLLEQQGDAQFWQDADTAAKVIQESNQLKSWVDPYQDLQARFDNLKALLPEACSLDDEALLKELLEELTLLEKKLEELELRRMLCGPYDNNPCYLSINAGAGGTESCDWVDMLMRMYDRWAVSKGWQVEIMDRIEGDVAGSKSCTLKLTGPFAYGYARAEQGVHRLVRISPFDANQRRHTSFASVEVLPDIPEEIDIEIRPEDLRIETYRASGAGGQHVNKTDSAVRMTHLPSHIVVSCQNERSQLQNRETCLKMLKAKLFEIERRKHQEKLEALSGEKKQNAWGSQIRNYVFQPYTIVKDARTGVEIGDVLAVMNGEIDPFIQAYLKAFGGQDAGS
jgi:peptide chain release factor 2